MAEEPKKTDEPSKPTWEVPLEDPKALKVNKPSTLAGGIPAIMTSLSHTTHEMGMIRGGQALRKMNQKGGFDCPGCGWPDPDDDRAFTEIVGLDTHGVDAALRRHIREEFPAPGD